VHQLGGTGQFRRDRHHSKFSLGQIDDTIEELNGGFCKEVRLDHSSFVGVDKRAFEVQAEQSGAAEVGVGTFCG